MSFPHIPILIVAVSSLLLAPASFVGCADGQNDEVSFKIPEPAPSGDDDASLPGDDDASLPGDDDASLPGDDDASLPGDDDASLPGDDDASQPGDDDASQPGDDDASQPGDDDASQPGDDDASQPGDDDATSGPVDHDGDGFSSSLDCDDNNAAIHPGAPEVCDGLDNNCNDQIDEGVKTTFYQDVDQDGYGIKSSSTQACAAPAGYAAVAGDCDDSLASVNPGAIEQCNGVDDDCDGQVDENVTPVTWYLDLDGDGYGTAASTTASCSQPDGYAANGTDCNDADAAIHPAATETCNGIDDNCDGQVDEGLDGTTRYADADGDGYGDPAVSSHACTELIGYVLNNTDCDDTDASIHPGATEECNSRDDDCDGQIDEGFDKDQDGYSSCASPSPDCNDSDASIHPGATETCNGVDQNCDGNVDGEWSTPLGTGFTVQSGASATNANGSAARPFPSVQQAIEATGPGCYNVSVGAGIYSENLNYKGKPAVVVSVAGAVATILDGGARDSVVRFQTQETQASILKGFTMRNGSASNGGGIACFSSSPTLQSNVVQANLATGYGGGVYLQNSKALLKSNTIAYNVARSSSQNDGRGGGVYITGGQPTLENNTIKLNAGQFYGGGIAVYGGARPVITGGEVSQNTAGSYQFSLGGGLYSSESYPQISQVKFDSNVTSAGGGGIYILKSSSSELSVLIQDSTISANHVTSGAGGGIYVTSGDSVEITRTIITRNTASSAAGGIYAYSADIAITNNLVHCNSGGASGGGIYLDTSYPEILNNNVLENSASVNGGGIYIYDSQPSTQGVVLSDNLIYKNSRSGLTHTGSSSLYQISYNDVYDNDHADYDGIPDQKGKSGNISADPKFTSYKSNCDESDDNYLPGAYSPLIDAGEDTALEVDLPGTSRPQDGDGDGSAVYDIGAYERVSQSGPLSH